MQIGNTGRSWGAVQRTLHWTLAVMVIGQLVIGDILLLSAEGSTPNLWSYVHPTVGILIGVLMVARLAWRASNPVPAVPEDIPLDKQVLSQATHYAFYFLLICNPVVGYLLICTMGSHVHFFTAPLANVVGQSTFYEGLYFWMHLAFGVALGALVVLHPVAALYHELVKKDNVLRRMLGFIPMTAERQAVQEAAPVAAE